MRKYEHKSGKHMPVPHQCSQFLFHKKKKSILIHVHTSKEAIPYARSRLST